MCWYSAKYCKYYIQFTKTSSPSSLYLCSLWLLRRGEDELADSSFSSFLSSCLFLLLSGQQQSRWITSWPSLRRSSYTPGVKRSAWGQRWYLLVERCMNRWRRQREGLHGSPCDFQTVQASGQQSTSRHLHIAGWGEKWHSLDNHLQQSMFLKRPHIIICLLYTSPSPRD